MISIFYKIIVDAITGLTNNNVARNIIGHYDNPTRALSGQFIHKTLWIRENIVTTKKETHFVFEHISQFDDCQQNWK